MQEETWCCFRSVVESGWPYSCIWRRGKRELFIFVWFAVLVVALGANPSVVMREMQGELA